MSESTSPSNHGSEFTNHQVDNSKITTEALRLTPLSPKYRQLNLIWSACLGAFLVTILALANTNPIFSLPEKGQAFVLGGYGLIVFVTVWNLLYHFFADPLKKYALREHDLNYQSGLLFRSLVSQPILRIQHIEIKRGPIERKAGLATLQVFSAGGVSHTFNIPGLAYEDAIRLRQFILDHKDLAADV